MEHRCLTCPALVSADAFVCDECLDTEPRGCTGFSDYMHRFSSYTDWLAYRNGGLAGLLE